MSENSGICEYLLGAREKIVCLPKNIRFDGANFGRAKDDLIIGDKQGCRVFVRGFFAQAKYPSIVNHHGEHMAGDLAAAFVKLSPLAVTALLEIDKQPDEKVDSYS